MCKCLGDKYVFPVFLSDHSLKNVQAIAWRCECNEDMFAQRDASGRWTLIDRKQFPYMLASKSCEDCCIFASSLPIDALMAAWKCSKCKAQIVVKKDGTGRHMLVVKD